MDNLTFDKHGQIRVLEQDKYEEAKKLEEQCFDFMESK
jgi:hypothetical protein